MAPLQRWSSTTTYKRLQTGVEYEEVSGVSTVKWFFYPTTLRPLEGRRTEKVGEDRLEGSGCH